MKGYLPHQVVKAVVFWVLALCIFCSTTAAVLLAWEGIEADKAYSLIRTAVILASGAVAFLCVNLAFGSLFSECFTTRPSEPIDPAFADRLQRAKGSSQAETSKKSE